MGATELKSFISYRRDDAIVVGNVDRIYEQLSGHFGSENVFMDVDTIPPGQDFRHILDEAVAKADVLLAVMGKDWTKFIKKRSRDPKDFVRIEIESAFQRNIPVVPVLIGDTKMPLEKQLPASIKKLAFCNAVRIDVRRHFQSDVERLIADLERHYGRDESVEKSVRISPERPETTPPRFDVAKAAVVPVEPSPPSPAPHEILTDSSTPQPRKEKRPIFRYAVVGLATTAFLAVLIANPWSPRTPALREGVSLSSERPETTPPPSAPEEILTDSSTGPFENSLGMKFVPVPGLDGVFFSVWETRVQDYAAYASAPGNSGVDDEWKDVEFGGIKQMPDHPVVNVSWVEAKSFCEWLSQKEGRTYRLPTDHEWSVAVGIGDWENPKASPEDKDGGISDVYPWGDQWPPPKDSGNFSGTETMSDYKLGDYTDAFQFTAPVGSFELNHFGIKDLSGNAYEWCEDFYNSNLSTRVLRGGSWFNKSLEKLWSSNRYSGLDPGRRVTNLGFRCVLEISEAGQGQMHSGL